VNRLVKASLTLTAPASIIRASRRPRARSRVQTVADRPYSAGIAQSWFGEALLNSPVTAHILGGAITAVDPSRGVIDMNHRVFGYQNLLVCDGAAVRPTPVSTRA
jgi:cholesterol oxidase